MSDTVMRWVAAAAFIAALGTPADAADLSPLSPHRHRPHSLPGARCHPIMYLLLRRGVICPVLKPANMPATRF